MTHMSWRLGALACVLLSLAANPSLAQNRYPGAATTIAGSTPTDVAPVARPNAVYTETTLAVTGGVWAQAVTASTGRQKLILGDATGLACVWSTNASPAAGQGFPFSFAGTPNAWVLDDPVATNAIYVKCTSSGTITIGAA